MNNSQSQVSAPVLTKVFAKVYKVEFDVMNENCLLTFLGTDNKTTYTKTIFQNMVRLDSVLENLGTPDWDHLPATKGNVVQLALYDGVARYINQAKMVNGVPVAIWKAPVQLVSKEVAAAEQLKRFPPQPEMSAAESDKHFQTLISQIAEPAVAKTRVQTLFDQLDSELQLSFVKLMAAIVEKKAV